ncbi:MAG: hypothetical protein ACKPKO_60005, partial [Candidatus Fonsibacter sp.]
MEEKEVAALAKWQRNFANLDIVRRGVGADMQLGVIGVPRTEGFCMRESRRDVTCIDTIASTATMSAALNELADHGTTAQAPTGMAVGEFGAAFLHGRVSASSDTLPSSLPACTPSAPPASNICDPAALDPPKGYSGTHDGVGVVNRDVDKRALNRMHSDSAKKAKGGVT